MSLEEENASVGSVQEELEVEEAEDDEELGEDEEFEDDGEGAQGQQAARFGAYGANDVNDEVFEELLLPEHIVREIQLIWEAFIKSAESREAAGEAIYAALFDAAPSLQSLFKTPRAVMAMRFMNGINTIISGLHEPKATKITVETLGFQHLDLEVTIPRVGIFRDAIVDLLAIEMGSRFTQIADVGFRTLLNYVGGAYIYVRVKYAERIKCLVQSWAIANQRSIDDEDATDAGDTGGGVGGLTGDLGGSGALNLGEKDAANGKKSKASKKGSWFMGSRASGSNDGKSEGGSGEKGMMNASVPKNFNDMFMFNAAVMGFGGRTWMMEVLGSFDTIVSNVANSYRLQEECDVLSLRIGKFRGSITLSEYKSVMLASLRSLVKDWGSLHEISWSWLWENVERMLMRLMGKPAVQEQALSVFFASLDDSALGTIRREVYSKFFSLAPAGQDYFKQSTTRLHFIADKLVVMTLDMYKEPKRMVEDISALGLRHVGYGIPTDLFGPFVTACVQVVRMLTDNDAAEEAFRWSLSLISRILTRVINEGSTIVMKAINANSAKSLRKAVACAPRGKRALWMLNIQVGTQSISPMVWAIETGSLDAAKAIIQDLLTIRADRDSYYYGMDIMFERHPDIIRRICLDAPALLPTLLDGLVWRSRVTENGLRRVNYYVKHLVVDEDGQFAKATEWITSNSDPKLVCHPVVALVTDTVWSRIAFQRFLYGKAWFVFTLLVFVTSQAVLIRTGDDENDPAPSALVLTAVFVCRLFVYLLSMGHWIVFHVRHIASDVKTRSFSRIWCMPMPNYLTSSWQDVVSFVLTLLLLGMLLIEPVFHCLGAAGDEDLFSWTCPEGQDLVYTYSIMSAGAMIAYFLLLCDLSVFSTRVSAFALVCGRVLSEVALFLFGLSFFVLAFSCGISALRHNDSRFNGIPKGIVSLLKITFGMFSGGHFDALEDNPALMVTIFFYVITTVVFLLNLLIAQLNCAYQATYQDMLGYARLNRGKIVTETMVSVSSRRWEAFVASLRLNERCEFGEGDVGLAGGMQVFEPASANITTVDMIKRFGGSTSPAAQWPEDHALGHDDEDRFERMEKQIEKAMKKMRGQGRRGGAGSSAGGGSISHGTGSMMNGNEDSGMSDGSVVG